MTRTELEEEIKKAMKDLPVRPAEIVEVVVRLREIAVRAGWEDLARVCLTMEWSLASGFLHDAERTRRVLRELAELDGDGAPMFHVLHGDQLREQGKEADAVAAYERALVLATEEDDEKLIAVAKSRLRRS